MTVLVILLVGGIAFELITPREPQTAATIPITKPLTSPTHLPAPNFTESPTVSTPQQAVRQCARVISLRVGDIDPQFNLDTAVIQRAIGRAAEEWNSRAGVTLFSISMTGDVPVNFLFDGRQDELDQLKATEASIDSELARLKAEQAKRVAESESIDRHVKELEGERNRYEREVAVFNADVARIESEGAITPQVRAEMTRRRDALQALRGDLEASSSRITNEINEYNQRARETEQEGEALNEKITELKERFPPRLIKEAEHRVGAFVNEINVYTYTDENELDYTLLHELGHAIGLPHSDQPSSIMSPVRQVGAAPSHLTPEDIAAARERCGEG